MLGAAGRLGFAAAEAFRDAGWSVKGLVRPGTAWRAPQGIETIETVDRAIAVAAGRGMDVVLHALNPPYTGWAQHALPLTYSAIEIAEANGATLMFPGNLYNFGAAMPELIDDTTPMRPSSRKGKLRVEIEERMREACERGMRMIVIRAGDFFGGGRGSWFDLVVAKEMDKGIVNYPGPLDVLHEWAYVPDLVETMLRLAAKREAVASHAEFGFSGHAVTGRELIAAIAKAGGRAYRIKRINWFVLRTFGRLWAMGRELAEIGYLWDVPHRISGEKLRAVIGPLPHTDFETAIERSLRELKAIE